jgi:hypothetical protein
MTSEELEIEYQKIKKQSQQDYRDLFGKEPPSTKTNMNKLRQILLFLNEETPIKNSQIILESIFLTFLVIWFIIKG